MARAGHTKVSEQQFIDAIAKSNGIKATIARRLGINRNSVDNYLRRWARARAAYQAEVEAVGDVAEAVVIDAIYNHDVETAKWYCRMKLKHRGYTERLEHEQTGEYVVRVVYESDRGSAGAATAPPPGAMGDPEEPGEEEGRTGRPPGG